MRRLGAVALLVAAASAVVAIAATGVGLLLPAADLDGNQALALRIGGGAAVAAGLAGLVRQRKRLRSSGDRYYDPTAAALVAAAAIMGVLALMARLAPAAPSPEQGPAPELIAAAGDVVVDDETESTTDSALTSPGGLSGWSGLVTAGTDRRVPRQGEEPSDEGGVDRSILRRAGGFILLLILLAIMAIGVLAFKGRQGPQREEPAADADVAVTDAEAALDAAFSDVAYDGPDPRRQITSAYQRLLAALAAAGAPREPQEAPHEHLHRALRPLGVRPEPMHSLTGLYVAAQFSERLITERHRAAAQAALEAGLISLRATNDWPGADTTESIPEEARA